MPTHLNVFRGFFWEGAKVMYTSPETEKKYSQNLPGFNVVLPWAFRTPSFLESKTWPKQQLQQYANPDTVFLEFHYTTKSTTEFRCATHFDMKTLIAKGSLALRAENNNHQTGNEQIQKHIPKYCDLKVTLQQQEHNDLPHSQMITPPALHIDNIDMLPNSIAVAKWLHSFLHTFMRHPTPFQNLRTFLRTPNVSPLFTNLPQAWQTPGSTMPPIVPIYLFLNAMILNNYIQEDITHHFMRLKNVKTGRLLRVIRDTLLGFTMCPVEGKYTPDRLCGIDCDDQPFVDGLNNDTTYFARDDCEGRLQQGQTVLNCICAFLAYTDKDIFQQVRRENHSILAQLSDSLLFASIQCLQTIAWLFRENIIEFKMVVGEATFASYPRKPNQPIKYTGHSFGALVCLPQDKRQTLDLPWLKQNPAHRNSQVQLTPALQIVEATGWMDEYTQDAEKKATKKVNQYFVNHPQAQTANMRSCTTCEQVDELYSSIYTLGQHLIFGFNNKERKWQYGASPSQILKQEALMLTPTELFNDMYKSIQEQKPANQIVEQAFANHVQPSLLTLP
eukprot:3305406-Rhodomonas_salina.3